MKWCVEIDLNWKTKIEDRRPKTEKRKKIEGPKNEDHKKNNISNNAHDSHSHDSCCFPWLSMRNHRSL